MVPKPTKGDWDMKKKILLVLIASLSLTGCSSVSQEEYDSKTKELTTLQAEFDVKSKDLTKLQDEFDVKSKEFNKLQADYDTKSKELEKSNKELSDVQKELAKYQKEQTNNSNQATESETTQNAGTKNKEVTESESKESIANNATQKFNITKNIPDLTVNIYQTSDNLICEVSNTTDSKLSELSVSAVYYDAAGSMISMSEDNIYKIMPGQTTYYILELPADYDQKCYIDPTKADITVSASVNENSNFDYSTEDVKIESNLGSDGVMAKFTNISNKTITKIDSIILYYKDNSIIGYATGWFYDSMPASGNYTEQYAAPQSATSVGKSVSLMKTLSFDDYKIIIQTIDEE